MKRMIPDQVEMRNGHAPSKASTGSAPAIRSSKRKPRLLVIGPIPPPYIGPAVATDRLLRSSVISDAFDVEFLDTSDRDGIEDIGRLNWHNISMALGHGWRFLRMMLGRRPDVVYISIDRAFWGFLRDLQFLLPAWLFRRAVLVHLRAGRFDLRHDFGGIGRLLARIGLGCSTRAIVLGESVRDVFGAYARPERLRIVPNGMNLRGWDTIEWPDRSLRSTSTFRIAYIANLYHDKGAHVMLAALPAILQSLPDLHVTFAGRWVGTDEYRRQCTSLVQEHGLEKHVEFIDGINEAEKKELLAASDLAVFVPVKPEGQPWVVLEAMAAGLPVVGSPQGTMREVIVDGQTGYLVAADDPAALAERVIQLAGDRELRLRLGRNGRQRVEEVYAEEVTHRQLVEVAMEALTPALSQRERE
jgi:glycosyltransferase involved in cell wall biosynthesis